MRQKAINLIICGVFILYACHSNNTQQKAGQGPDLLGNDSTKTIHQSETIYQLSGTGNKLQAQTFFRGAAPMSSGPYIVPPDPNSVPFAPHTYRYKITAPSETVLCLALSNHAKVWLLAGSSVTFSDDTSTASSLEVSGIAYVVMRPTDSMIIKSPSLYMRCRGASVSVWNYPDLLDFKASAAIGYVEAKAEKLKGTICELKTGQCLVGSEQAMYVARDSCDPDDDMKWTSLIMPFDKKMNGMIMKELENWYDIQFGISGWDFSFMDGAIGMNSSLADLLKILQINKSFDYRIDNRKIIITKQ